MQRVSSASVTVDGAVVASIGHGLCALVGLYETDGDRELAWTADKIVNLRIFPDAAGKLNLAVGETGGGILLVPNFTVAGDARKGRRPSFDQAMRPERASAVFERFIELVRGVVQEQARAGSAGGSSGAAPAVETGVFRAHMRVELVNDGPVTLVLESPPAGVVGTGPGDAPVAGGGA